MTMGVTDRSWEEWKIKERSQKKIKKEGEMGEEESREEKR